MSSNHSLDDTKYIDQQNNDLFNVFKRFNVSINHMLFPEDKTSMM